MSDDSLISAKAPDGFKSESPIRAFTDFQVAGNYAIGKGFRPSMGHLSRYLDAMLTKEGWGLVQVLLPDNDASDPTMIFERIAFASVPSVFSTPSAERRDNEAAWRKTWERFESGDDPVNPKHYAGTRCAEIGELLTANSYQVLKYNWRLGQKDDPCVELGKALWYLDREIRLLDLYDVGDPNPFLRHTLPVQSWFDERLEDADEYVRGIAVMLIDWNRGGDGAVLRKLRVQITAKRAHYECGSGLAI